MMLENGKVVIIDFDRLDYGDRTEDLKAITWTAQLSPSFAAGQIDGYSHGGLPLNIWRGLAYYIAVGCISHVSWAISRGQEEVDIALNLTKEILSWYNNDMNTTKPTWYTKKCAATIKIYDNVQNKEETVKNSIYLDKIILLEREKWQGHLLAMNYVSHNYYDVVITRASNNFNVAFIKKPFDTPFEHKSHDSDRLFQPYRDNIKAWGIVENGRLIAAIETAVEEWSNRLLVSELWVDNAYRRKGIATALMDLAVKRAKDEKRRVLMLETQSRNEGAIEFYLDYGFTLIGFDSCAYQNNDLERNEVRIELGIYL
jgi:ribosomal protein S18 acetylase RimI-like enzyme